MEAHQLQESTPLPAAMRAWPTPPITRSLWRTRPTHTETIARKTPIPTLKVRKRRGESGLNRTSFRCVLQGRILGRRRWWWNDRWTVVASNSIGQFPRGQPGSGSAAAIVAAEIDQRELRPGRSEVERTAVIDANGAYVAGVHVLEGCRTGPPCADHRGACAVNPVIFEVHVRDRVQVFYGEIADQHDRVVGVVKKAVADHLDVRVNTSL